MWKSVDAPDPISVSPFEACVIKKQQLKIRLASTFDVLEYQMSLFKTHRDEARFANRRHRVHFELIRRGIGFELH